MHRIGPINPQAPRKGQPWTSGCEVPGRQESNSPFNKLVFGVRVGHDVHENLNFGRTDLQTSKPPAPTEMMFLSGSSQV